MTRAIAASLADARGDSDAAVDRATASLLASPPSPPPSPPPLAPSQSEDDVARAIAASLADARGGNAASGAVETLGVVVVGVAEQTRGQPLPPPPPPTWDPPSASLPPPPPPPTWEPPSASTVSGGGASSLLPPPPPTWEPPFASGGLPPPPPPPTWDPPSVSSAAGGEESLPPPPPPTWEPPPASSSQLQESRPSPRPVRLDDVPDQPPAACTEWYEIPLRQQPRTRPNDDAPPARRRRDGPSGNDDDDDDDRDAAGGDAAAASATAALPFIDARDAYAGTHPPRRVGGALWACVRDDNSGAAPFYLGWVVIATTPRAACPICADEFAVDALVTLPCEHRCCGACLGAYIDAQLEGRDVILHSGVRCFHRAAAGAPCAALVDQHIVRAHCTSAGAFDKCAVRLRGSAARYEGRGGAARCENRLSCEAGCAPRRAAPGLESPSNVPPPWEPRAFDVMESMM